MELFRLFATLGLRADEFNKGVDQAENRGSAMAGKVKKAFLGIGAAAVAMGGLAIRAGMEIDDSLRSIRATTGMTEEDINKVERAFRDMALEGNFSAAEITGAMSRIAVAGQDAGDAVDIMEAATRMAAATGKDLGDTAYFLGNYLLKVGKDSSYAEKYIDVFTQGMANSNIGLADMQNYMFRMTPAFNQFGSSVETNVGLMTRLYQAGIRGASLYSGMGTIMMDFGTKGDMTADMLRRFNISMVDANGNARENKDLMFDLAIAMNEYENQTAVAQMVTENMNQAQQQAWFEFMELAETIRDDVIPSMYEASDAADGMGIAYQMAEERTGGIRNEIGRFRNSLTELKLSLFDVIEAPFGQTMGNFNDTIQQVTRAALPPLKAGLRGIITVVGGLLSAAVTLMPVIVGLTAAFAAWKATLAVQSVVAKYTTFINAARDAKKALTIANNAAAVSELKLTKAQKAAGAVMALFTKKTHGATAAIIKKNLAMKANTIGLVIAGVAALAASIAFLATRTARQTEEQIRLNEETVKLREETDRLTDSVRTSADAHAENVNNIEVEIGANRRLLDELRESKAAYDGSAESRARIATSVQRLNESMGDLNLQYDMETGLLNKTIDSIEELIETRAEQARAAAAQARAVEIAREQIEVEEQRMRLAKRLEEARQQGIATEEVRIRQADGSFKVITRNTEAYSDLLQQARNLNARQRELGESFEFVSGVMVESNEAIIESTEEVKSAFETAKYVYGEFSEQAIAAFEAAVESGEIWCVETIENYREAAAAAMEHSEQHGAAMEALGAEYERVRDRASDAFGVMSENVSVNMEQATANIEENTRLITEQAENTATAMTRAMEKGVDEGVLRKMEEMANRGPGYAAMLANASDEQFAGLVEAWGASAEAAVGAVATRFGADEDVVREAANLAESTAESLRSQLEAADISQMGDNVAQSLMDGIAAKIPNAEEMAERLGMSVVDFVKMALGISSPSRPFTEFGENLPTSLGRGITRLTSTATTPASNMAARVLIAVRNILTAIAFDGIAANIMNALASGITNRTHIVVTAITRMANAAVAAANDALQIRSPSKPFDDMGDNVTRSFANRVIANRGLVANAMDAVFGDLDRVATASTKLDYITPATPSTATLSRSASAGNRDIIRSIDEMGGKIVRAIEASGVSIQIGDDSIGRANDRYTSRRGVKLSGDAFANAY